MKFLFDLGGVFFDWDPKYFFKNIFIDQKELNYFLGNICNDKWNSKQDKGRSIDEAEKNLISIYPKYEKQIKMYYSNHHKMIKKTYRQSIDILNELKKLKYQCFVLSNWSYQTFEGMHKKYPFLNSFDDIIISGLLKKIKPHKDIYRIAIKKFKLNPVETIFIDDKFVNIVTAKKLGFKTIHLTDPRKIKLEIYKIIK